MMRLSQHTQSSIYKKIHRIIPNGELKASPLYSQQWSIFVVSSLILMHYLVYQPPCLPPSILACQSECLPSHLVTCLPASSLACLVSCLAILLCAAAPSYSMLFHTAHGHANHGCESHDHDAAPCFFLILMALLYMATRTQLIWINCCPHLKNWRGVMHYLLLAHIFPCKKLAHAQPLPPPKIVHEQAFCKGTCIEGGDIPTGGSCAQILWLNLIENWWTNGEIQTELNWRSGKLEADAIDTLMASLKHT